MSRMNGTSTMKWATSSGCCMNISVMTEMTTYVLARAEVTTRKYPVGLGARFCFGRGMTNFDDLLYTIRLSLANALSQGLRYTLRSDDESLDDEPWDLNEYDNSEWGDENGNTWFSPWDIYTIKHLYGITPNTRPNFTPAPTYP